MSQGDLPPVTLALLRELLESADPAALLVAPRLLRRIIKHDRKLTHLGLQVPHRKTYVIGRDALLAIAESEELGVAAGRALPDLVVLIARPDPEQLACRARGQILTKYWRLLFHARVHVALERRFEKDRLTEAAVRQRIHRIGRTEFDEIRSVLRQEKYLLPPHDDRTVLEEFAALYLELRFFAPMLVSRYFPTLDDPGRIDQLLAEDVDAPALFAATRLPGARDPVGSVDPPSPEDTPELAAAVVEPSAERDYGSLASRADQAAAAGNVVRAAIRRARAARAAPPEQAADLQKHALDELSRLAERLRTVLHLTQVQGEAWRRALGLLLSPATQGIWPADARLLYDLQKVCIDHERPIYAPDLVDWALSGFNQPLVRPLPNQPFVLAVKHLRSALARVPAVHVAEPARQALSRLLHDALHEAEGRLRDCFRRPIQEVLAQVGLEPQNFPERLAKNKLVEELLDRITERGFLNMSHVRDALARNQVKLADLSGPRELLVGDPLLRADRALAHEAPGVYRHGEFYLRWLQRGSALAFGTRLGRWFMLFAALPFLGAFATIVFVQEMLHLVHLPHHLEPGPYAVATGILGVFYLVLMHMPASRPIVLHGLTLLWRLIRGVFYDVPAALLRAPALRWLLDSRPLLLCLRFLVKPLPVGVLVWMILGSLGAGPAGALAGGASAFLVFSLLLNTRLGRDLEEALVDTSVRNWDYLRGLVPGLVRLFMDVFKTFLEAVDRFLYAVDEWLRFRGGESRLALVVKTVLGFVWFLVTYVVRLYVNVLIEPTVNPIKHFPAVTVAAKLLVPFWIPLLALFGAPFEFLGRPMAFVIANFILHSVPGAAGFLVWEFKANWRLYRSNRPRTLSPEIIGHHGETMLRFMKPGFHSGTLPKLYAKIRRAERRGDRQNTRRLREMLHHALLSIEQFAERELVAFLCASKGWTAGPVNVARVTAGCNRIRLMLACPELHKDNLEIDFEEQAGWLLAHVDRPGWLTRLASEPVGVLKAALLGFYHKAGVDLVREQLEASLGPVCPPYDIGAEGLIVWPGHGYGVEVVYDLHADDRLTPCVSEGQAPESVRPLPANQILFRKQPITWESWVAAWERDQAGAGSPDDLLPNVHVLPDCR